MHGRMSGQTLLHLCVFPFTYWARYGSSVNGRRNSQRREDLAKTSHKERKTSRREGKTSRRPPIKKERPREGKRIHREDVTDKERKTSRKEGKTSGRPREGKGRVFVPEHYKRKTSTACLAYRRAYLRAELRT